MLFFFLAFLLLSLRDMSRLGFVLTVAVPVMIFIGTNVLPRLFPADGLLLTLTNFLCALGVLVLYSTNPSYALQQAVSYGIGLGGMIFCIYLIRNVRSWKKALLFLMPFALFMLILPVLTGTEINGAKNWIRFGPVSFQPSEPVKLVLILALAFYISERKTIPWLLFTLLALSLLMLEKDLGTALLYYCTALLIFWAASGNLPATGLGIFGGCGAALLGYRMFAHVRTRVRIWQNPWEDVNGTGFQLIRGLMAIASGGWVGVGLGLGAPTSVPVYESDFIFSVICEQFGLIFGICVLIMYLLFIWRSTEIAMAAGKSFCGLLTMGATVMLGLQTFVIIGGILKLIPLTGVTLPFISYGGSSLVSSMCMTGLIQGVESLNKEQLRQDAHLTMLER